MFSQLPDELHNKKLLSESSAIAPTDEQCERMLRNVLAATGQSGDTATYTEIADMLGRIAARERRLRRLLAVGVSAAVLFVGLGLSFILRTPPLRVIQIEDDAVPLVSGSELSNAIPRYDVTVRGALHDELQAALRGLRRENGQLYFYFENGADGTSWRAVRATAPDGEELPLQELAAGPLVRFPYPDAGLDIVVTDENGAYLLVEVRSL